MKPSKTAYPTKKKPAKRKLHGDEDYIHDSNPIVSKLLKLKYRINDAYRGETVIDSNKSDKDFVMGLINNIRNGVNPVSKIQLEECNKIWKRYA